MRAGLEGLSARGTHASFFFVHDDCAGFPKCRLELLTRAAVNDEYLVTMLPGSSTGLEREFGSHVGD